MDVLPLYALLETVAAAPEAAPEPAAVMRLFGRMHPAMVHFPIALIVTAAIAEVLNVTRPNVRISPFAFKCLLVGALTSGLAAWFGWINADLEPHGRAVEDLLFWHRWSGVAVVVVAVLAVLARFAGGKSLPRWSVNGYRAGLIASVLLVGFGGYLGGEMVYGQGYLLEVFSTPSSPSAPPVFAQTPGRGAQTPGGASPETGAPATVHTVSFATDVWPIIEEHCLHCHGPRRSKGQLRLDRIEELLAREPEMRVIEPGDAEGSVLVQRIMLPLDHEDLMPADDDPLPAEKVRIIRAWIEEGASWTAVAVSAPPAAESGRAPGAQGPAVEAGDEAARASAMGAIRDRGGLAGLVSEATPAVDVNLSHVEPAATDADLALLSGLESSLTSLNLSRSAITDAAVRRVAEFTELRRLRLDNTAVTDAGVQHLAGLTRLEYLNLYGTAVTDAMLATVAELPALAKLYLWQTNVTPEAVAALREARPELDVNLGETLLAVEEKNEEPVLDPDAEVVFADHVQPIFAERCFGCHGEERQRADLRLDRIEDVLGREGDDRVIVAGDPDGSLLVELISHPAGHEEIMPAKGDPLSAAQIDIVRRWIEAGARLTPAEPGGGDDAGDGDEPR